MISKIYFRLLVFAVVGLMLGSPLFAQIQDWPDDEREGIKINYTEAHVGSYTLPDPLTLNDGERVTSDKTWFDKRQPEILTLFEENQFGKTPGAPKNLSFDVFDQGTLVFDGKAIRKQVTVYFSKDTAGPKMDLLIYLPAKAEKPVAVLLNIGFVANSSKINDPGVKRGMIWDRDHQLVPAPEKSFFGQFDPMPLIENGFGFASVYYGDIDPDFDGGIPYGVRSLYLKTGQTAFAPDEWGAISAWAWGLSRAMDYFETDKGIDSKRVALFGISRLGKTVLWTAAHDPRFALVIASCSGEGGAALSRRNYGETIKLITLPDRYDYQFCGNYARYGDDPNQNPVDAHMLLSLIAPRPVLLQTGNTDKWSDPKGEFLAVVAANPVYQLLGQDGIGTSQMPKTGQAILRPQGYYMHDGGHGTVASDWDVFIEYLKKYL